MTSFLVHHLIEGTLLGIIFITGILVFTHISDRTSQMVLIGFLVLLYFSFGIAHHVQDKTIRLSVVLEYFVVSALLLWVLLALSF